MAFGASIGAYFLFYRLILPNSDSRYGPLSLESVSNASLATYSALNALINAPANAMLLLFFFFLLRVLFRKQWLAAAVFTVLLAAAGIVENHRVLSLALNVIPEALVLVVTIRFGVLAMIATFFIVDILLWFPVTTDLSTWYAPSTLFAYALVLALAGYAFRMAVAGRPLFRSGLLDDA